MATNHVGRLTGVRLHEVAPHAVFSEYRLTDSAALALLVASAYYVGCQAGFALRFPSSGISFFWPPTAVLTAALLVVPFNAWPIPLASSFIAHAIAHWQDGVPIAAWPIQYFGNATQAAFAAWLVRRYSNTPCTFASARSVLVFIFGAGMLAPAAASLIPASAYVSLGWAADLLQAWRVRAISNAFAMLTIVPSLLAAWRFLSTRPAAVPRRIVEFALLLLGVSMPHVVVHYTAPSHPLGMAILLYAPVPLLLWAAVRFGVAGVAFTLLSTALVTISTALHGLGPWGDRATPDGVIAVQLILAANAIPMMLLAGVTEHNRREHASLVDIEHQNSAILRALPDLTFLQTRTGASSGNGWSVMSVAGRPSDGVLPPDVSVTSLAVDAGGLSDEPSVVEYTHVIGDEPRRFEARFAAVDDTRVLTIVRDITDRWRAECELREARQRYALATRAGGIGVWEFDIRTGAVRVEGTLKQTLGYEEHEIGNSLAEWELYIFPADREDVLGRLWALANSAADAFESEFRMLHKDGSVRWLRSKGAITDRHDGRAARIRGTYIDVTDSKEAARALRDANDALVRMGRVAAMAEVSASIAHELHQPLSAIVANASAGVHLMEQDTPDDELREVFTDILHDSRRAAQIIQNTRRMFTQQPMRTRSVDLNAVVRDIVEIAAPRLVQADVRLTMNLDDQLPAVLADTVQMQQVLLNLLTNAVDAMRDVVDRPRRLEVATRHGRRHAVVSVRDTGHGLGTTEAARIFQPFYTTRRGGTGMGLPISHTIVRNHMGALWAVHNAHDGMTFRFKIPLIHAIPRGAHDIT